MHYAVADSPGCTTCTTLCIARFKSALSFLMNNNGYSYIYNAHVAIPGDAQGAYRMVLLLWNIWNMHELLWNICILELKQKYFNAFSVCSPFFLQIKLWYESNNYLINMTVLTMHGAQPRDTGDLRNPYVKVFLLPDRT